MTEETQVIDEAQDYDEQARLPQIQRYAISAYGADLPIDTLYTRLTSSDDSRESDIYVPDFQRGYVWTKSQADRFIESILLGLPIPGIFLFRDEESGRLLIVDGSQRLRTIKLFIDGVLGDKVFTLGDRVHEDFRGKSHRTLDPVDRRDFSNTIIHATIVKQERPENDRTSIYYIFDRLNTSGTPAQPQEVRRAIYSGKFASLLERLNDVEAWRALYGPKSPRRKDEELVLRFLALFSEGRRYGKTTTMKDFLTNFMARHRDTTSSEARFSKAFQTAVALVLESLGRTAFRTTGGLNVAIFDSVMVGISRRLDVDSVISTEHVKERYEGLLQNPDYIRATQTGTSQERNVRTRLDLATGAFEAIQ